MVCKLTLKVNISSFNVYYQSEVNNNVEHVYSFFGVFFFKCFTCANLLLPMLLCKAAAVITHPQPEWNWNRLLDWDFDILKHTSMKLSKMRFCVILCLMCLHETDSQEARITSLFFNCLNILRLRNTLSSLWCLGHGYVIQMIILHKY